MLYELNFEKIAEAMLSNEVPNILGIIFKVGECMKRFQRLIFNGRNKSNSDYSLRVIVLSINNEWRKYEGFTRHKKKHFNLSHLSMST